MIILLTKMKNMRKDFTNFYIKLAVLAGMGMSVCVWLRPEMFTASNIMCWFYIVLMFLFFRMDIDDVKEKPDFQVANWFALFGIEVNVLLGLSFWFAPLFATVSASSYFLFRAWVWKKKLNFDALRRSAVWLTFFNYIMVVVIKFAGVPLWHWLFG